MAKKMELNETFVANNKDLNEDQIIEKIAECAMMMAELKRIKKDDDQLNAAKDIVKQLAKGHNAAINLERSKIDFLLDELKAIRDNQVNPTSGLK